jgi:putative membrane protein
LHSIDQEESKNKEVPVANHSAGSAVVPLDATQLAAERTRLAHERTLMAWIRTATSLISFGFTIYKFFQALHEQNTAAPHPEHLIGFRGFALLMIIIGLVALLLATVQHRRDMQTLRMHYPDFPYSLATVIAILIAGLGILGLFIVLFRQ